jgi:zinc transporter ZupT
MKIYIYLLIFGLLAATGTLLGGWVITGGWAAGRKGIGRMLALGAGFMLAAVFLEAVPEILELWSGQVVEAMSWVLGGYLLIQFAEHALASHLHFGEEVHAEEVGRPGAAAAAVLGLAIHAFFDGVTIASGLLTNLRLGIMLSLAVLLHKLPEGLTAASIVLSAGRSMQAARRATIWIAGSTFAGIVLVALAEPLVTYTLPLSAGVTLYIAASDLIPEANREGGARVSVYLLLGIGLFYIAHLLLHAATGE